MAEEPELLTVFRSGDASAEEDAIAVRDLLGEAGLSPAIFGDDSPEVPEGVYEVRVPAAQAQRAEEILKDSQSAPPDAGEPSEAYDLVPVFSSDLPQAEMEAMAVRAILDSYDILSVTVGSSPYPSLPVEVRVPKIMLEAARTALAEARAAGPEAAEQAEREGETGQEPVTAPGG
jgi:hypothetical protein